MKALVSAVIISALASGSALAADLSLPARAPVTATYDWSGVYVGGHIGGGWEKTTFIDPSAGPIINGSFVSFPGFLTVPLAGGGAAAPTDARANSFLGGVQGGWMYQIGRLVVGGDFDLSWTRLKGNGTALYGPLDITIGGGCTFPCNATEVYSVSTKWTGTATTTIGVARDRWMFYSKAGVAFARQEYGLAISGTGPAGSVIAPFASPFGFAPASVRDTLVGWTIGTGVKWAITNEWFLNLEYDYMDFGSKGQNFTAVCSAPVQAVGNAGPCLAGGTTGVLGSSNFSPTFNSHISEVKVGLNYKFPSGFLFW